MIKLKDMKRTPLKRKTPLKTKASLKRVSKKRTKKPFIRLLKDKLWKECQRLTRERFQNPDGTWNCYTCNKVIVNPQDAQTGHGKPKGALSLRYQFDIRNLRVQCMVCNVHRGGMQDIFIAKLEQEPDGFAFLKDACYIDEEANAWRIRYESDLLGGKDSELFITRLLEQYRGVSYR